MPFKLAQSGRWTVKSNFDAVATLKSSLLTLRALTTVAIHWVPGHSLIYGNEVADLLAKRGADGTTCSSMPDVPTLIDLRLQCNLPILVSIPVSGLSVFAFANCLYVMIFMQSLLWFLSFSLFITYFYFAFNLWFSITSHFSK